MIALGPHYASRLSDGGKEMRISELKYDVTHGGHTNIAHGCHFDVEYKPEQPDFVRFYRFCMEPPNGPCWKANATKVILDVVVTDKSDSIAVISGGVSAKAVRDELLKLYPPTHNLGVLRSIH